VSYGKLRGLKALAIFFKPWVRDTKKGQDFTMKMSDQLTMPYYATSATFALMETLINVNVAYIGNGQEWTAIDD